MFSHRYLLQLALPMIISNISTPLLGLVDTAVMGHQDSSRFLAAVALGSLVFSFIYWGFGFLRMSTTGLTAQAFGEENDEEMVVILFRGLFLACVISGFLLGVKVPLSSFSFALLSGNDEVKAMAAHYFEIRIWSAPATLSLYVLMGWLLGVQKVKVTLLVVLITNISNIILDVLLVFYWKMGVEGVALSSVVAEYLGLLVALLCIRKKIHHQVFWNWKKIINFQKIKTLMVINGNIFIRTGCLIFAFAFFTAEGARLGVSILAANAVLLNFQNFMAYALDGFAYAAEALVGRAIGMKSTRLLNDTVKAAALWSFIIAVVFAIFYWLFGYQIINLLTALNSVREIAYLYLPWLILMPVVSFVCYLLDGVFIGAMLSRQMRNSMLFSLFMCFLPVWYFTQHLGNHGLWLAMTVFMVARGLSMSLILWKDIARSKRKRLS